MFTDFHLVKGILNSYVSKLCLNFVVFMRKMSATRVSRKSDKNEIIFKDKKHSDQLHYVYICYEHRYVLFFNLQISLRFSIDYSFRVDGYFITF